MPSIQGSRLPHTLRGAGYTYSSESLLVLLLFIGSSLLFRDQVKMVMFVPKSWFLNVAYINIKVLFFDFNYLKYVKFIFLRRT